MITLEEAQYRIWSSLRPLEPETVDLYLGLSRVTAERIVSPIDLPGFDNSAMDGYAVRADDLANATVEQPAALQLAGKVAAGAVFDGELKSGQCVRLHTGSPIPRGADAVVMQEDTWQRSSSPDVIYFNGRAELGQYIRRQAEDVRAGDTLIDAGTPLTAGRICLLAAAGLTRVRLGRRPVVGLIATGNELQECGQPLSAGQVYECNRIGLTALLERWGVVPRPFPIVKDNLDATQAALKHAFAECDVVLSAGGVSVGEFDWVKQAFEQLGGTVDFWRVSIKPGKPFVFGRLGAKFLFGLPGNPVSAIVTCLLFVWPALQRLQGAAELAMPSHPGILAERLENRGDRRHFMRVIVGSDGMVRSAGMQQSHILSSLALANGLVDVAPGQTLEPGAHVNVLGWD